MEFFNNVRIPNAGSASKFVKIALGGAAAVCTFFKSFYNVDAGHRAIVFNRIHGIKDEVYPEGTHFLIPWIERPIIYDVRACARLFESTCCNADRQMVNIGLRVLTRPIPDQLPTICLTMEKNYNDSVLPSIIYETLEAIVGQHNTNKLITQREAVSLKIRKMLIPRASNFNIIVDDVSITSLSFGDIIQVAEEDADRAKQANE